MNNLDSLCILIPFRFGNQEIVDKNLEIILNKSLFERSFNHAKVFRKNIQSRICLSTNKPEVILKNKELNELFSNLNFTKSISKSELCLTPTKIDLHQRSNELASKVTPISDVLRSVRNLYIEKNFYFKYWLLLQPTSPFRSHEDFSYILNYLNQIEDPTKEVSLVSVTGVDGFHPARMYREKQGKLQKFLDNSSSNVQLRQELEPLYIRDGAFYFFSDELAKTGRLGNDHPDFFIRNFPWNVNIDTNQDLQLARNVNKAQVVNDPNNEF